MKLLISAACVAVIAFVGYFFWGEYERSQASKRAGEALYQPTLEKVRLDAADKCDIWVRELTSWRDGKPIGKAKSFAEARNEVDECLRKNKGTEWYDKNIAVKYW